LEQRVANHHLMALLGFKACSVSLSQALLLQGTLLLHFSCVWLFLLTSIFVAFFSFFARKGVLLLDPRSGRHSFFFFFFKKLPDI